jgi:hypothetical protein
MLCQCKISRKATAKAMVASAGPAPFRREYYYYTADQEKLTFSAEGATSCAQVCSSLLAVAILRPSSTNARVDSHVSGLRGGHL